MSNPGGIYQHDFIEIFEHELLTSFKHESKNRDAMALECMPGIEPDENSDLTVADADLR